MTCKAPSISFGILAFFLNSLGLPARAGDLGYSPAWPPQSSWQESYCRPSIALFAGLRVEAIPSMSWCARGPAFYLTRRLYEQRWALGQPFACRSG